MFKSSEFNTVSFIVLTLLLSSFLGTSTGVPTGEYLADFMEVPILANEILGLDDPSAVDWRAPIGSEMEDTINEL